MSTLITERTRLRAETVFKQKVPEALGACANYEASARALREKTVRLRALRLARDAQSKHAKPRKTSF